MFVVFGISPLSAAILRTFSKWGRRGCTPTWASQGVFWGGQSRDIFRGVPVKKITLYVNCLLDYNLLNWGTDLKKEVFVQDGTQDNEEMSDRSANTEAEDGLVDEEEDIKKHLRTMAEQKNWIKVTSMLALLLL